MHRFTRIDARYDNQYSSQSDPWRRNFEALARRGTRNSHRLDGLERYVPRALAGSLWVTTPRAGGIVSEVIRCRTDCAGSLAARRSHFAMSAGEVKKGPYQSAVFGLSHEVAHGLAKALAAILDETTKPTQEKPTQN